MDTKPRRGRRFRHATLTSIKRTNGVDETTDVAIITTVRGGRVYYRFDHGEPGIGQGNWYADLGADDRFPSLRPGFVAHVAEWLS